MKHCPICNAKYESGRFCLDCGEPLVDDAPAAAGMSLNLGDGNAISGGVKMNDSHNVSNIDQRVINTSNVSNVTNNITQVERQRTEQEMAQERKIQFMELCKEVYADGILEDWESARLEAKRIELGIDRSQASEFIELARRSMSNRLNALSKKDEVTMKIILGLVDKNQKERIEAQLPRLQAMSKFYQVDEVLYTYNMLLAALHPEELARKFEDETTDEYWQTFWTSVAYMKLGKLDKSEETSAKLNYFKNYSENNDVLLLALSVNHEFGAESAKEGLSIIDDGSCSPELKPLFLALCLAIDPERAEMLGADKAACQFYLDYIVSLEDPKARAERLAREQAEAERKKKVQEEKLRKQITYSVSITKIDNQLLASMTARTTLGWTLEVSRTNFAKLPYKAKSSENKEEIEKLADKLSKGGMTVEVTAINGLNEMVSASVKEKTKVLKKETPNSTSTNTSLAGKTEAFQLLNAKKEELHNAKSSPNKDYELIKKLYQEFTELVDAVYKDHAKTAEEVRISIERRSKRKELEKEYAPKIGNDNNIKNLVRDEIERLGKDADLNHIDVSKVTHMVLLFCDTDFCGDVSGWDVSNVKNMNAMFYGCENFNCDLNDWDVSNVNSMAGMFQECKSFNKKLRSWDVSRVKDMHCMFFGCISFNQDLSKWDVSNVTNNHGMFQLCDNLKEEYKPKFKK